MTHPIDKGSVYHSAATETDPLTPLRLVTMMECENAAAGKSYGSEVIEREAARLVLRELERAGCHHYTDLSRDRIAYWRNLANT